MEEHEGWVLKNTRDFGGMVSMNNEDMSMGMMKGNKHGCMRGEGVQVTLSFRKSSNLKTWLVMKLGIMLSLHTDRRTIERLNLQHL